MTMSLSVGSNLKLGIGQRVGNSGVPARECSYSLVVRNTATSPASEQEGRGGSDGAVSDSSERASMRLRPAPKLRPREKFSRGDAPGEYGGPPIDLKIRRTWGGTPEADPLTTTDDYIWKKVWQPHVETPPSEVVPPLPPVKEPDSGFLSLNRALALDSMDVDLSRELLKPSKATLEFQVAAARRAAMKGAAGKRADESRTKWRYAPTKREEEQWARANKAVSGGTAVLMKNADKKKVDPVKEAAAARERYLKLKQNLQLITLATGGAGLVGSYFNYTPEVAASYGVGLLGALAYVRMLGNSVDGLGANSAQGAVSGALGQPRLLVPVVLVMVFNRWNGLAVPQYDVMPLQLIPMLVGFFTYKAATLAETFRELLPSSQSEESDS